MKRFDLEAAKTGAKLITREGRPARIACWDVDNESEGSILALVRNEFGEERPYLYNEAGEYKAGDEHSLNLFLAPTKHEGWVNVYRDGEDVHMGRFIYKTKEEAIQGTNPYRVACVHIEWEE